MSEVVKIDVFVFNEGVVRIPADILIEARKENDKRSIFDKRTKGYKVIENWASKVQFPYEGAFYHG